MALIGLDYGHGNNTFPPNKGLYKNGKAYHEHQFNASLGLKIKNLLEAEGHKILEAQPAFEKEVGLTTRTNLYNISKVDIVISLHANAGEKEVDGRCVFYWGTSTQGKQLATLIIDAIKKKGYSTHGNGLHASKVGSWTNLHICRETKMPAVLVENGFMTNENDFELIFGNKQDKYTDDLAKAYVEAVQAYFDKEYKEAPKTQVKSSVTKASPKYNLKVDGIWGSNTTKALQKVVGTVQDGVISNQPKNSVTKMIVSGITFGKGGSLVIKALQKKVGAKQDGLLGPITVRKIQKYLGTPVDGIISDPSAMVKAMQIILNEEKY